MAGPMIVAQFVEYSGAHRALCELIQTGTLPTDISIVAGDRSNSQGGSRDLGILERHAERYLRAVRRGRTLLAVEAAEAARARSWRSSSTMRRSKLGRPPRQNDGRTRRSGPDLRTARLRLFSAISCRQNELGPGASTGCGYRGSRPEETEDLNEPSR